MLVSEGCAGTEHDEGAMRFQYAAFTHNLVIKILLKLRLMVAGEATEETQGVAQTDAVETVTSESAPAAPGAVVAVQMEAGDDDEGLFEAAEVISASLNFRFTRKIRE